MNTRKPQQKERIGTVVSDVQKKTIVVMVERRAPHPKYGKMVAHRKKFHAHDEKQEARRGDVVRIIECRPVSKLKRWRLGAVLKRPTLGAGVATAEIEGRA